MSNIASPVGDYNPNPYAVNNYQLPDGRVVALTNQQFQQIFGNQGNQNSATITNNAVSTPAFPPRSAAVQTQQVEPEHVNGRFISSHDEIAPSDVPMNGRVSIFPMSDYSCIFAKKWDANGNIVTVKYVPAVEAQPNQGEGISNDNSALMELMDKVNNIQDIVTQIQKQRQYKKPYNKNHNQQQKKEG